MGSYTITPTALPEVLLVTPQVFADDRGFFLESYNRRNFNSIGISCEFVQDNHSRSTKGVLRGLHFQKQFPQDKLVRVIRGEVFDVAVDIRVGSPRFGNYVGVFLTAEDKRMLFVPKGFAHGFLVLSDTAEFMYKVSDFYNPADEGGIVWNDPDIGIEWPFAEYGIETPTLSKRDREWNGLKEQSFPFRFGSTTP
jgi:dTDP-4-dehydrorhamnose 3,5-epimerase